MKKAPKYNRKLVNVEYLLKLTKKKLHIKNETIHHQVEILDEYRKEILTLKKENKELKELIKTHLKKNKT